MPSIAENLVKSSPMKVSQAESSPTAAMTHTLKTQKATAAAQTEANRSVGGGRRKKYKQRGGNKGIVIPQAVATGGSSAAANAGLKQNFTAITQAGANSEYDKPPKLEVEENVDVLNTNVKSTNVKSTDAPNVKERRQDVKEEERKEEKQDDKTKIKNHNIC